ncbi:MAG TPA: LptF/LptG family permease [Gemmataceae bacterium]|nr:LptF/LptG family permease [Gemmataceae bacterium]
MFGSILHRTILWELVRVFALALVGIMSILIMGGIVAEASQQGLKPNQILAALPLLVPSFLPYTIPATTLFATCVVYGRLAADNEILAIKAAGINILRVIWPGILLGLLMSATTMALFYQLIPYTHQLLRARVMNDVEEYFYDMLKRDRCIKQPKLPYAMWVRQVQGTHLQDALFKRLDKQNHYDVIATAREAELRFDMANHQVLVSMRDGEVLSEKKRGYFQQNIWPVPLPPDFGVEPRPRPRALSWQDILARRREVCAEKARLESRRQAQRHQAGQRAPELKHLRNQIRARQQEIDSLDTELHMRPALSFGCLCFVLVGCPIGVWFSRSDYLSAFITCFLPIVFLYYPVLLCTTNYARQGYTGFVIWSANAAMVVIGMVLFRQLLKH